MYRLKGILDSNSLKIIYFANIHSHLQYAAPFLSMCNKNELLRLERIQKNAIKIICGSGYRDHTQPLFLKEKILPIKEMI